MASLHIHHEFFEITLQMSALGHEKGRDRNAPAAGGDEFIYCFDQRGLHQFEECKLDCQLTIGGRNALLYAAKGSCPFWIAGTVCKKDQRGIHQVFPVLPNPPAPRVLR